MAVTQVSAALFGVALSHLTLYPIMIRTRHAILARWPFAFLFAGICCQVTGNWMRPNKHFHEIMAQPNPHGSYARKMIKYHFPIWYEGVSATLHEGGYNLIEMYEYDKQLQMPELTSKFDDTEL